MCSRPDPAPGDPRGPGRIRMRFAGCPVILLLLPTTLLLLPNAPAPVQAGVGMPEIGSLQIGSLPSPSLERLCRTPQRHQHADGPHPRPAPRRRRDAPPVRPGGRADRRSAPPAASAERFGRRPRRRHGLHRRAGARLRRECGSRARTGAGGGMSARMLTRDIAASPLIARPRPLRPLPSLTLMPMVNPPTARTPPAGTPLELMRPMSRPMPAPPGRRLRPATARGPMAAPSSQALSARGTARLPADGRMASGPDGRRRTWGAADRRAGAQRDHGRPESPLPRVPGIPERRVGAVRLDPSPSRGIEGLARCHLLSPRLPGTSSAPPGCAPSSRAGGFPRSSPTRPWSCSATSCTPCSLAPAPPPPTWARTLTWVLWWPLIPLLMFALGRLWCAICPFATVIDTIQKLAGLGRPVTPFLKRYGIWVIDATFILITWADHVFGIVDVAPGIRIPAGDARHRLGGDRGVLRAASLVPVPLLPGGAVRQLFAPGGDRAAGDPGDLRHLQDSELLPG